MSLHAHFTFNVNHVSGITLAKHAKAEPMIEKCNKICGVCLRFGIKLRQQSITKEVHSLVMDPHTNILEFNASLDEKLDSLT